ncbi:fat-like cadherin-related tumor suppressor, partial [Nephila pilipes]
RNLARRVPEREEDVEVIDTERRSGLQPFEQRESGDYRRGPIGNLNIPRPHVGRTSDKIIGGRPLPERRDSGGYRRGFSDDDRMYSKAQSTRRSNEESRQNERTEEKELPVRKPLSRSSDHLENGERKTNMVQYRNRGYEED